MKVEKLAVIMAAVAACSGAAIAQESEVEIPLEELPPVVREAADEHVGQGEIRSVVKEVEDGEVHFEIEILEDGRERDVLIDSRGEVVEIGQELDVESLPKLVFDRLVSLSEGGRILEVESTSRGDTVTYEAIVATPAGRLRRVKVGADGRRLAPS